MSTVPTLYANANAAYEAERVAADDYATLLTLWQALDAQRKVLANQETELRKALVAAAWPKPEEGVNHLEHPLADGRKPKMTHKITRKLTDGEQALAALRAKGVNDTGQYIRVRYELAVAGYKAANTEIREVLDEFVVSRPGTPTLEVA